MNWLTYIAVDNNPRGGGHSSFIIDIGANCGDTVAALIKHTVSDVLCVEPVPAYFGLLEKNLSIMGREFRERIITFNAFVGCEEKNWTYKTEHGTAHMVEAGKINKDDIPTYSLPNVLQTNGISDNQISLIKVDTDGYDADCIMSMGNALKEINPPIFWENYIENDEQLKSYNSLMDYLADSGYTTYYVFDNFGNYMLETDVDGVKNINAYINRIIQGFSARTFYYVDILAIKGSKEQYENVIRKYTEKYA